MSNAELTEECSVVFPGNQLQASEGGCTTQEEFKQLVHELNRAALDVTFSSRACSYAHANREDNFIKSFPLQFPYGINGPNTHRQNVAKSAKANDKFKRFIKHVNQLSHPAFHTADFAAESN